MTDSEALIAAMQGRDVVYASLSGDMAKQARTIVEDAWGWIETVDLHQLWAFGEVQAKYRSVLDPYDSAAVIERRTSTTQCCVCGSRMTQGRYRVTQKGESFTDTTCR